MVEESFDLGEVISVLGPQDEIYMELYHVVSKRKENLEFASKVPLSEASLAIVGESDFTAALVFSDDVYMSDSYSNVLFPASFVISGTSVALTSLANDETFDSGLYTIVEEELGPSRRDDSIMIVSQSIQIDARIDIQSSITELKTSYTFTY